jgi:putative restriction endonuclease
MEFNDWLAACPKRSGELLKPASVAHYTNGLHTISQEMQDLKVISKPLESMDLLELDLAIQVIAHEPHFVSKDTVGNKMYSNALKKYRCYIAQNYSNEEPERKVEKQISLDPHLTVTERVAIIKARVGQGMYRERLFKKYSGQCLITHIDQPGLLIASHIKPWSVSSNDERVSGENGLLLSATYDKLFDLGFITFENSGRIHLSEMITAENAERLKLHEGDTFDLKWTPLMGEFLDYHRDEIFVG